MQALPTILLVLYILSAIALLARRPWLSRLTRVVNTNRGFGEADAYLKVVVQHEGEVVPLLMTQAEFAKIRDRAAAQPEEFNNAESS